MRNNILREATANVPIIDYRAKLAPVLQKVFYRHMPDPVKEAYNDGLGADYLCRVSLRIADGNGVGGNTMYFSNYGNVDLPIYGPRSSGRRGDFAVNLDTRAVDRLKKGTLEKDLATAVIRCGYYHKHYEQRRLLEDVKRRLKATLESVTTVKRLYDVLEPELHHLIPKEDVSAAKASLPAAAGPVVGDLRTLGAQLPKVPKVKK